ncbi:MAG TPA: hypothetical protein DDW85_02370 [Porphyromonadaceae bacterium]|nr:hypothetical protein [Porphyromonadaceae bacterium]
METGYVIWDTENKEFYAQCIYSDKDDADWQAYLYNQSIKAIDDNDDYIGETPERFIIRKITIE